MSLAFAACERLEMSAPSDILLDDPGEGKVGIDLTFTLPAHAPSTRALGELSTTNPIRNIYVAVFGSNHYLNEFVQAIPYEVVGGTRKIMVKQDGTLDYSPISTDSNGDEIEDDYKYQVRVILSKKESASYVHIVANVDDVNHFPEYNAYEKDVMVDQLVAEGGDGYWQYIELPGGIDENTQTHFSNLQLIRDFACVDVSLSTNSSDPIYGQGWAIKAYEVYNVPVNNLYPVAKVSTTEGGQLNFMYNGDYLQMTFSEAVEKARILADNNPSYTTWMRSRFVASPGSTGLADESTLSPKYVHENPLYDDDDCAYVIVKMQKGTSAAKYFRLDFRTEEDEEIPLLRNYKYNLVIGSISDDVQGYATPAEAALHHATLDAFRGMDVSKITSLDNGVSSLVTEYNERVFTKEQNTSLKYRYLTDHSDPSTDSDAALTLPEGDAIVIQGSSSDWEAGGTEITSGTYAGWRQMDFHVNMPPSEGYNESTFKIVGKKEDGTILKQFITIISMNQQAFLHSLSGPDINNNNIYTLTLTLPEELPESIFPLEIAIFQPDNKIATLGSDFDVEIKNDIYYYYKTITYDDYLNGNSGEGTSARQVKIQFKPTRTIESSDFFYIRDRESNEHDPYFFEKEISFSGNTLNLLAENLEVRNATGTATPINLGLNKPVTFTFDYLPETYAPVTVTLNNLEPADGETRLTPTATPGVYTFTPTAKACTLNLKNTTRFSDVSITLSQSGYNDVPTGQVIRNRTLVIRGYNASSVGDGGILFGHPNGPRPNSWGNFASVYSNAVCNKSYFIYNPNNYQLPTSNVWGEGITNPSYQHTRFRRSSSEAHTYTNQDELRVNLNLIPRSTIETARIYLRYDDNMSDNAPSGSYYANATLADIQDCIDLTGTVSGRNFYVLLTWSQTITELTTSQIYYRSGNSGNWYLYQP